MNIVPVFLAIAALIPQPQKMESLPGEYRFENQPAIRVEAGNAELGDEGYELLVATNGVTIRAAKPAGEFYARQTLAQLRDGDRLPCVRITDWPAAKWRGFMHDVGRNPQDIELLKKFVDVMARYKMNVFHWHLTDYPGYRIECRVHPELNDPKFMTPTRRPGFFYTYTQINDFIQYCRQRHIMVIPEIDMPGHSDYFKRAFGVDMQSEKGTKILKEVLTEFLDNVQTEYLHMGSDEVHLKLPTFMDEMADLIRSRGRKVIIWRPGHTPKGEVTMQIWAAGGKNDWPLQGVPFVDSRHDYVNHMDPFDGPVRIMNLATGGLGGILCHWPDNNVGDQMNIYRQSPVFPALLAAAERYWTGKTKNRPEYWGKLAPDFAEFEQRMLAHRDRYFRDWPFQYVKQTDIVWKLNDSVEARGATIHINHFWYDGWLPKAKSGVAMARTFIWSPKEQTVGFWINFNGPSRSGRDSPNPNKGEWSNTGSQVWVNDKALPPPDWKQPGKQSPEVPFVDEDYFYRPPTPVALKQGWNKIVIQAARTAGIRKWMFTCVPVQVTGNQVREVEGLKFATAPN